jgi:hypothetical protein
LSAHHRVIRKALLPEFGDTVIGVTDFIRLLMRKLIRFRSEAEAVDRRP